MPSSIKKNGRILWKGRVQKDGQIKQKHFKTRKEALDWEAEERKRDWSATDTESSVSMLEWSQQYLDYAESRYSAKTYSEKKLAFKGLFAAKTAKGKPLVDPNADVETLTAGTVLNVLQARFKKSSGNAANKDRKNFVAAWNWGIKYLSLPAHNPCRIDMFPEIRSPRYVPPEEDFWKVYDLTSGQDRVMLSVFLYLAARRGEVLGLQWTDVDFPNSRIRLGTRKRRDGTLEFDWLPMNTELEGQLRWWHENRVYKDSPHVFVCDEDYSYCREYRGGPFTKRCHFMHRMCGRAKVPPFGFHAIRHLVASKLYRMGKPLGAIQAILRHKSAGTTERYLKSLGLEETRVHLEALCDMRSPVKEANEASGKKPAKVINIKDRLEKRSQAA